MIDKTRLRGAGIVAAAALTLAALVAPSAALASQPIDWPSGHTAPSEAPPTDDSSGGEPHSTPAPTDGEVVYDGPFLTPTPDPTPAGETRDATGAPAVTPPATDALDGAAAMTPGPSLLPLLVAVGGLSLLILLVGRTPAVRRS